MGVALGPRETVSLMINEEDHLRLQVMRSGFALEEAWQEIDHLDDLLEQRLNYAFSEEFGYLTACPTNVGTGMRASVMLHLPAVEWTRQIEKIFRALQKINLAVRGLYGEGSRASGHFYQISNQVTLGKSETSVLGEIREVIPTIINYERQAREVWMRDNRQALQDRVSRAYGTLCSATMMTSEETMELLSHVRLGINLGLLEDLTIATVNELFIHTQPAHLQKLMGSVLDGEERNAARARYLRRRLRETAPIRIEAGSGLLRTCNLITSPFGLFGTLGAMLSRPHPCLVHITCTRLGPRKHAQPTLPVLPERLCRSSMLSRPCILWPVETLVHGRESMAPHTNKVRSWFLQSLATSLTAQQFISPGCIRRIERRLRIDPVVEVIIIATVAVTLLDESLQIEMGIGIRFP